MRDENNHHSIGIALVVLAAFCWGIAGGIAGILTANGWSPVIITLYRGGIGFVIVFCWLLLPRGNTQMRDPRLWLWAVIAGLGVAGNFLLYAISIKHGSVAVATTLMYCAPVYVYAVACVVGRETASVGNVLKVVLSLIGIVLLTEAHNPEALSVTVTGVAAGLLSGVCYAIFILTFKYASRHGTPQAVLTVAFGALLLSMAWLNSPAEALDPIRSSDRSLFLILGVLGAGLSFFVYILGMQRTTPTNAAIAAMVEPVTALLFGVLLLGEKLASLQLVGMALILMAATSLRMSVVPMQAAKRQLIRHRRVRAGKKT